jgi:hypothetical protein
MEGFLLRLAAAGLYEHRGMRVQIQISNKLYILVVQMTAKNWTFYMDLTEK